MRGRFELRRFLALALRADGSGGRPGLRRARRRRPGADAVDQDVLVAALRHAHRPVQPRLDGECAGNESAMNKTSENSNTERFKEHVQEAENVSPLHRSLAELEAGFQALPQA